MQKLTKNVDALGFDKWQIADVRRAYQSNKSIYTKMNKVAEKIEALSKTYDELKAQTEAWEGPVKIITQKVLGMDLTSQEVLAFHKEPKLFVEMFPEHPMLEEINARIAECTAVEAEESVESTEPVDVVTVRLDGIITAAETAETSSDIPF